MGLSSEITVREAARQIRLSERMIINFIQTKRFQALKVGRDWHIDYASFVAFAQKYGYQLFDEKEEAAVEPASAPPDLPEKKSRSKTERPSEKPGDASTEPGGRPPRKFGNIHTLRVYELFREILQREKFASEGKNLRESRVCRLADEALEELGAGFYAYGFQIKRGHYLAARARLGALLALLRSDRDLSESWTAEIESIEDRLLPAFGALLKKMEKKTQKQEAR